MRGAQARVCDVVVVNDELPRKLREEYAEEGQFPVDVDEEHLREAGVRIVRANVISETQTVRHDSDRLAAVVVGIIDEAVAQRASYVLRPSTGPNAGPATAS